jgi:hypothetical protein
MLKSGIGNSKSVIQLAPLPVEAAMLDFFCEVEAGNGMGSC